MPVATIARAITYFAEVLDWAIAVRATKGDSRPEGKHHHVFMAVLLTTRLSQLEQQRKSIVAGDEALEVAIEGGAILNEEGRPAPLRQAQRLHIVLGFADPAQVKVLGRATRCRYKIVGGDERRR